MIDLSVSKCVFTEGLPLPVQEFARLSGIGGLDYWTGILDWNTGMA